MSNSQAQREPLCQFVGIRSRAAGVLQCPQERVREDRTGVEIEAMDRLEVLQTAGGLDQGLLGLRLELGVAFGHLPRKFRGDEVCEITGKRFRLPCPEAVE